MSILDKLTEGIVNRNLQKEGTALLNKWEKTGLLEGLDNENKKASMSRLLENQAKELLREASSMAAGDVQGFAAVAFPIVRRVFGSLVANDLVSVQPMSLPSGLIFFLDFTFTDARLDQGQTTSLYGGGVVGSQLTGGVTLGGGADGANAERSFYALNNGYSSPTGSSTLDGFTLIASGVIGSGVGDDVEGSFTNSAIGASTVATDLSALVKYDADLEGKAVVICEADASGLASSQFNRNDFITLEVTGTLTGGRQVRRLTQLVGGIAANAQDSVNKLGLDNNSTVLLVFEGTGSTGTVNQAEALKANVAADIPGVAGIGVRHTIADNFDAVADSLGAIAGADPWGLEGASNAAGTFDGSARDVIPEIDIKVDSVSVTAVTKKLKAKWTPELGQDLQAYHNLDAEVELTSILSEQIALEIDRELLNELVQGAAAATLHWSRRPGQFLNRETGVKITSTTAPPDFTGTVSEWYETLLETVNDVSAQIHRKTLRGGANFVVCSPEVANILEFTSGFRASVTADTPRGSAGAVKVGQISKKFDIYVDPYFIRNVILVGRKGGSFLESGYVYAPYVPLQVTPTIFGTEDFVPRKGVMTRYAKKMVRPDMYGLVICHNLVD
tara:strand:- start:141 stop:1988 length:1848 start_codon:yes stop_codon:yes gene_type:complete